MEETKHLKKRDKTHRAIMHSAKMLFEKNGLGNVTIDQIVQEADVSRSTFFTHFTSLDDLLMQIADEEISDILESASGSGEADIKAVFRQISKDTYPYPNLTCQLFIRSIMSEDRSAASDLLARIHGGIDEGGYGALKKIFPASDISAIIFGAYFGLVFQKFIECEPFENPSEISNKMSSFIDYLKNQEE